MVRLKNKVAFVTGAASGIGRAEAILFATEGAIVVVADYDLTGAKLVENEIADAGGTAVAVEVDVSNRLSAERAIAGAIGEFGQIDILGLTAGRFDDGRATLDTDEELWDQVFAVNVKGLYYLTNATLPQMIERRTGAIVIVSANSGLLGGGGGAAYTASKHASIGYARHLSASYGRYGIRTNVVAPGITETPMAAASLGAPEVQAMIERLPAGRAAWPEEIAQAALFLASDAASYLHAIVIPVDGGMMNTIW